MRCDFGLPHCCRLAPDQLASGGSAIERCRLLAAGEEPANLLSSARLRHLAEDDMAARVLAVGSSFSGFRRRNRQVIGSATLCFPAAFTLSAADAISSATPPGRDT